MARKEYRINMNNYNEIIGNVSLELGFIVEHNAPGLIDVYDNNVRFILNIENLADAQTTLQSAKRIITKMYKEKKPDAEIKIILDLPKDKATNKKSDTLMAVKTFYVFDIKSKACPLCKHHSLKAGQYNIPAYSINNHFIGYYACYLWRCKNCKQYILSELGWSDLLKRIREAKQEARINPVNRKYIRGTRKTGYLYAPITKQGVVIYNTGTSNASTIQIREQNSQLASMNTSSILSKAGYSIKVPLEGRRTILKELIKIHGKRMISDYLRLFIRLHKGQKSYEWAISVWQGDIDYIARL